ncbi:MAG TPA: helicase-associated domain-containing protein [Micromonosporaceae bacterium]|nr:helicase-associated domain-containing protein [Micromonosporaceae bacterium]
MSTRFVDHLRSLPDDGLGALVRLRPDLVMPVPADITALAARAQSRLSVARALEPLDRFTLEILDALRFARTAEGTVATDAVLAMTAPGGVDPARVRAAVNSLRARFVAYGPEHALRLVAAVDEVCSPYPAGLGRPAAELGDPATAALVADAAGLRRTVLAAPPAARAVLDRLAAGPPVGAVAPTSLAPDADSPVRWLVERHLLVATSTDAVELPREVALVLRRDTGPVGQLHPSPPALEPPMRDQAAADRAGAGQAMEAVRHTEALLEALSAEPATVLRTGGLGVRDLRRLARSAGLEPAGAGTLIEVAAAAGLLADSSWDSADALFLPTAGYDAWRVSGIAVRWTRLAHGWLAMSRAPSLIGERDDRDRVIGPLSPEVERSAAPAQRRAALAVLAGLPPGSAPTADEVAAVLAWRAPRRASRSSTSGVQAALSEAALLGLTGSGALTGFGRLLLDEAAERVPGEPGFGEPGFDDTGSGDTGGPASRGRAGGDPGTDDPLGVRAPEGRQPPRSASALDALLPGPVDHVLVQADLTIIVPGPPEPVLSAELEVVAEAESPSVHRVTPESVRRALDTGYAASDLHSLFARRSRTPVPQSLTYLVDDVARRHGGLRVGAAGGYLRSDDEALMAEVLADRRLAALSLRRLAPTVLATPYAVARLLGALREAGYAPVQEDATGATVLSRPKTRRAGARPSIPTRRLDDPFAMPRLSAARLAGVIEQIRRGDAAARAAQRMPATVRGGVNGSAVGGTQQHTQALSVLQQAMRDRAMVWVGYVDAHGSAASRLVRPVSMSGGYLRAEDDRTEMVHTFALHRITAAVIDGAD